MRHLYALVILMLIVSGCQKEVSLDSGQAGTGSGPGGGSGGGSGSGGSGSSGNSYGPTTKGSWWQYKDSASGSVSKGTLSAVTKIKNGITFTAFEPVGPDTSWMASPVPNYYMTARGTSPNTGAGYDILFHYLNDTASVGYHWSYNAGQGNGFIAYIETTIMEKGLTMSVAGKTYTSVIHTKMELSYDIMGTIISFGYYDWYIAKGVGIIKIRSHLGLGGVLMEGCSDLVDHSIK